ncbi:hypothetical protein F0562_016780 [Nyssa sinensis]|uniref:Protein BIC1 n=1 Tax=Nyssa sinensis TaxID=561372 RepID=A0A5J4ZFV2_9ASTE|nr:hypothetical protein F0562_016780 [Nyssa sinensis]
MAPQDSNGSDHKVAVSLPSEPQKASNHHHHLLLLQSNKDDQMVSQRQFCKTHELDNDQTVSQTKYSKTRRSYDEAAAASPSATINTEASMVEDTGRERLKRHRVEVAGRVWIPDLWGQEELLKDWIDCTAFDASLGNNNIMSARAALVEEGRRANASGLRIENRIAIWSTTASTISCGHCQVDH